MLFLIVIIVWSLMNISLSVLIYRKLFNPLLLFSLFLCLACLFSVFNFSVDISRLSYGFVWILIGMVCFCVTFLFFQSIKMRVKTNHYVVYNLASVNKLINLCCVLISIEFIVSLLKVLRVSGNFINIFIHSTYVRYQYLNSQTPVWMSILGWLLSMNIFLFTCLFPMAIKTKQKHIYLKLVFAVLMELAVSIVTMSKEAFIIYLIILLSAFLDSSSSLEKEVRFVLKNGKWVIFLIVGLLVVISYQRNYLSGRYGSYGEAVVGTISKYISISVACFSVLISQQSHPLQYGRQCFRPIYNILSYLGIGTRISIIQEQIPGAEGNVYTIFGNMFHDFGFMGIIILSILIGGFMGIIYQKDHNNRLDIITVNALINATMIFGFYDFKLNQTIYLFSIIYAVLFCKFFSRRLYVLKR